MKITKYALVVAFSRLRTPARPSGAKMRNILMVVSLCTFSLLSVTNVAANTLAVDRGITAIDSTGIVSFDQSSIPSVVLANFDTIQWTLSAPTGN